MAAEHVPVPAHASDWPSAPAPLAGNRLTGTPRAAAPRAAAPLVADSSLVAASERSGTPLDADLLEVALVISPGKAPDLGCGEGWHSIWLVQWGWFVTAVDPSPSTIA